MLVADITERAVVVCVCVQGQGQVEQTQTSSSLTSSRLVAFAQPANPFRGLVVLVVDQLIHHATIFEWNTHDESATRVSRAKFHSDSMLSLFEGMAIDFHPPTHP